MRTDADIPTLLIVDDTPENVDVLAGILRGRYRIKVAMEGPKALRIARGDPTPDLILLDVMMPGMDGYEVCRLLQQDEKTRGIPIIYVTAKSELEDEAKGFELGAVDYITKPVRPPIVEARVRTQLALKQARSRLENLSAKLSRYLSPQICRSIFDGKQDARIGSSRKKLTVFFSDVVGFTKQIEGMEPEDLAHVLNSYLNRMAEVVLKHGGTLDKFMGDAILVFFGDPDSKGAGHDAAACIEMALEMQHELAALNHEWETRGISGGFQVRMGVTTGFCTVGNFGSQRRMDYTIIGKQVNLASRLQAAAKSGQILIAHPTWLLVRDTFDCIPMDPIRVKGFEHPVQTYTVRGGRGKSPTAARMTESREGFTLALDPAAVRPTECKAVEEALKEALKRLQ